MHILSPANLELVVQGLDVILYPLNELCLVLPDGPADVGPHEQGIVAGEDTEHLIGTLGCAKLVSKTGCNPGLNMVNMLIIPTRKDDVQHHYWSRVFQE